MRVTRTAATLALALCLASCSGMRMNVKPAARPEPSLQHVVLVQLDDPSLAPEMIRDMSAAFPEIPQVRGWQVGPRVDVGRKESPDWYTVGILTQFDGLADYRAYLEHPRHKALAAKWKPRWKRAEVLDFGAVPPEAAR